MKLDKKLLCKILFAVKEDVDDINKHLPNYSLGEILYHGQLLEQAGFIKLINVPEEMKSEEQKGDKDYWIDGLTWKGQEFVDKCRTLERVEGIIDYLHNQMFMSEGFPFSFLEGFLDEHIFDFDHIQK